MRERRGLIFLVFLISFSIVSAAIIQEDLHVNIQTTDSNGNVITGTYNFVFNISRNDVCSDIVYSDSAQLTTDQRGIISYYLENVNLDYSEQYWLCHYRDGNLIASSQIARTPYAFRAEYVNLSGVEVDSNFDLSSYNLSAAYLFGDGSGLTNLNISSLDMSDYFTSSEILGFGYYNSSNFNINDYYLKSNPYNFYNSTTIPNYILSSEEGNLNVNSSVYWAGISSVSDILGSQITNDLNWINATTANGSYVPYSGATQNVDLNSKNLTNVDRLGVGTASPQASLHVNYPTSGDVIFQAGTGDGGSNMDFKYGYNGYGWYNRYLGSGSGDNNEWQLWSEGAGSTDQQVYGIKQSGNIDFKKQLTVQGNVGIGTTSPSQKLEVAGNINVTQNMTISGMTIYKDTNGDMVFRS